MSLSKENIQDFLLTITKSDISNMSPASGGDWSQAYFFESNHVAKVIRFSPTDEDFQKDKYAYQFNSPQLPIPEIEEIGSAFDGYYAISNKIDGQMIDNLSPLQINQFLPQIFKLFDTLKITDISNSTGFGSWDVNGKGTSNSWKEFLASVNQDDAANRIEWRSKLENRPHVHEVFENVYSQMTDLLEFCPKERHLIHNDLLHFNLLVNDNQVSGVIDWGCSLYGDFLYDLAMFDLWQFYYPSMQAIDFKTEAYTYFNELGVSLPDYDQRIKCYQCHLALDAIKYCSFKDNDKDLNLIVNRINEIIST